MSRTFKRALLIAAAFAVGQMSAALAQTWPSGPIRLVVAFPAGGAADQLGRLISQPLNETLGQPLVIENKAGAGGNVGGEFVARSTPDGYTLLLTSGGMVSINPHLYAKMPFDPTADIVPVAALARVPLYLVVRTENPAKDFNAFLADIKANPGKRNFGSPGVGSSPHLGAEMLRSMTRTDIVHVPYRGAAPALTDLLGGQLDFLFDPGIAIEHVKAGKLRLLAVGSPQRLLQFLDTPTLHELGLTDFDGDSVFGVYAPAKTPPEIVARLNTEINKSLANPAMQERITAIGNIPAPMSPAEFAEKSRKDSERYGAIIRERGITASN
ncbi:MULTISPECIES: tripartite tricarboxylate transporter substrate binding protein [unclassified Beijerinckia]|uniref:Bug family tripartite tricarboxylate transporter substrate binding protein n=1 Tax=unclassified Beijerinckia TaxID=2638183 RepID=UPI0008987D51|nr:MULTISPECIES: tripartite tricarboxylate transporter substrate binding protein [unclassified Beijerinckia]MDH7795305.1 tripartite-type tricarboxylate transporter receptor subunit TctC [Beijerinckia sp. GAS462]SEB96056.1 Tripartite-type tricarboxylate transporter, receptor component TctC [Beijerinckia sp. 28-YEA-48]